MRGARRRGRRRAAWNGEPGRARRDERARIPLIALRARSPPSLPALPARPLARSLPQPQLQTSAMQAPFWHSALRLHTESDGSFAWHAEPSQYALAAQSVSAAQLDVHAVAPHT